MTQADSSTASTEAAIGDALAHRRHLAEERGQAFDPAKESGPLVLYQIDGDGAVVR